MTALTGGMYVRMSVHLASSWFTHLAVKAAILLRELIHLVRTYIGSFWSLQTQFELAVHLH